MTLYTNKAATLGSVEGIGYAFQIPNTFQEEYQGVFFTDRENSEALEALIHQDEVEFSGTFYKRTQAGTVRGQKKNFVVDVQKVVQVSAGLRVNFAVIKELA
jgi:hypothetical protein